MIELTLSTPALLFPAVSLLLLAYTNRFLAIASLIRNLHTKYQDQHQEKLLNQIRNLRRRVNLIRNMQALGIFSLLLCVICMFLIFFDFKPMAAIVFATSLISMIISLTLSLYEIYISTNALEIQLNDLEEGE